VFRLVPAHLGSPGQRAVNVVVVVVVVTDVAMSTIFGFIYMGCTLAPPGEYD